MSSRLQRRTAIRDARGSGRAKKASGGTPDREWDFDQRATQPGSTGHRLQNASRQGSAFSYLLASIKVPMPRRPQPKFRPRKPNAARSNQATLCDDGFAFRAYQKPLKCQFTPAVTASTPTLWLYRKLPLAGVTKVEIWVPKSKWRYSILALQDGRNMYSNPMP
jgi:hypothetical protein